MEDERFVVEIVEYGNQVYLYERIDGRLTAIDRVQIDYAIDREIANIILSQIKQFKPFMEGNGKTIYKVSDDFGEALKMHIKVFKMLPTLHEKLIYIDQTQIFTLMETQDYKELIDRLNVYYLAKKIEGIQEP